MPMDEDYLVEDMISISAVDAATGSVVTVQLPSNARFVVIEKDLSDPRLIHGIIKL